MSEYPIPGRRRCTNCKKPNRLNVNGKCPPGSGCQKDISWAEAKGDDPKGQLPGLNDAKDFVCSTGRVIVSNGGNYSISPDLETMAEGYDGIAWQEWEHEFDEEDALTPGELVELADHMIERWGAFRAKMLARGKKGEVNEDFGRHATRGSKGRDQAPASEVFDVQEPGCGAPQKAEA